MNSWIELIITYKLSGIIKTEQELLYLSDYDYNDYSWLLNFWFDLGVRFDGLKSWGSV